MRVRGSWIVATIAFFAAALTLQASGPANAGSPFVAGKKESSVSLSPQGRSAPNRRPSSGQTAYQTTNYGQSANGPSRIRQPSRSVDVRALVGPNHGRRLSPAEAAALVNHAAFRKCGVEVSCEVRVRSQPPVVAPGGSYPGESVGDQLAREVVRFNLQRLYGW
jgi:hypothetical protein